jgi:hypothetical protein
MISDFTLLDRHFVPEEWSTSYGVVCFLSLRQTIIELPVVTIVADAIDDRQGTA